MLSRLARILVPAAILATAMAAPGAEPGAQPFARISIASKDRLKQAMDELGLPVPYDFDAGRAVGDGLDTSRPIGAFFLIGGDLQESPVALDAFPVKEGKATLAQYVSKGAKPIAGMADAVQVGEPGQTVALRRTAGYVYMMFTAAGFDTLKKLDNAPFDKDYVSKDTLAYASIDAALARKIAPKAYQRFTDVLRTLTNEKTGSDAGHEVWVRQIEVTVGRNLDKVDTLTLRARMNQRTIGLDAAVTPSPLKGTRTFARPELPANSIVSAHFAFPDADATGWLDDFWSSMWSGKDARRMYSAEEQAVYFPAWHAISKALVGDEQSVAVEYSGGKWRVTIINQYQRDVNLPEIVRTQFQKVSALDKGKNREFIKVTDTTGPGGMAGVRITVPSQPNDKEPYFIDVLQSGKLALVRVSQENGPPPAVVLSPTEKVSDLSVNVHLAAALQALASSPDSMLAGYPPEKLKSFITRLANKDVKIVASGTASGAMAVSLDVPVEAFKVASEFFQNPAAGPQPATLPARP